MARTLTILAAALTLTVALPVAGQATDSTTTITGPQGVTTQVDRSVQRENGTQQGTVRVEREDGRGRTRDWSRTRQGGVVSRQDTVRTNDGRTWTREAERSCANGSCGSSSVVVGPNGRTWRTDRTYQRTAPGEWRGEVTRTRPDGRSSTTKRWYQIRRQEN